MAELVKRLPVNALKQQFKHNLAVVVGINEYAHVRPLNTARADAERLACLLQDPRRDSHDRYQVEDLYDEEANWEALSTLLFTTLPALVKEAGPQTRVLFYFAGHGDAEDSGDGLRGFLFPQDAKPEDKSTLIPMSKVQDAVAGLDCQHVLLVLDCCSAGALPKPERTRSGLRPPPLYWEYLQRFVGRKARQVITSSAHNQKALDTAPGYQLGERDQEDAADHSPFAQALFEALDPDTAASGRAHEVGRDGVVTATELYLHISEALYRRVGDKQTPGLWTVSDKGHDQGEFVFLRLGVPVELERAPDLRNPANNPWPGLQWRLEPFQSTPHPASGMHYIHENALSLARMVESQPMVTVTGPSLSGKNSLVLAGLVPLLTDSTPSHLAKAGKRWHVLPPLWLDRAPMEAIGQHLAVQLPEGNKHRQRGTLAHDDPDTLLALSGALIEARAGQRLLMTLHTRGALFEPSDRDQLSQLGSLLNQMARQDILHIVLTLRSYYWADVPWLPANSRFHLEPLNRDALRQVVEEPAAARMMYLSPQKLSDTLAGAVEGQPAALPLLSETLHRMYLQYADDAQVGLRTDRTLIQEDYEAVGRVGGVVADLAEKFYEELPDEAHGEMMQWVLMRLVTMKDGQYVRRRAAQAEFDYPDPQATARAQMVIAGLAERGLVVQGADAEGHPYVELGHLALAETWAPMRGWLVDPSGQWGLQGELTSQVEQWMPDKQKADLWDDDPQLPQLEDTMWPAANGHKGLIGRLRWLKHVVLPDVAHPQDTAWLNRREVQFVQESVSRRAKFLRRIAIIALAVMVVLLVLTSVAILQRNAAVASEERALNSEATAVRSEGTAVASEATAVAEAVQRATAQANEAEARALAEEKQAEAEREARIALSRQLAAQADNSVQNIQPVDRSLLLAVEAFRATADKELPHVLEADAALRSALAVAPLAILPHGEGIQDVAFSSDGTRLITISESDTARRWDATHVQELTTLHHEGKFEAVVLSPDGTRLVTRSDEGIGHLWDAASGQKLAMLAIEETRATGLEQGFAFSSDGERLLTVGVGKVSTWDAISGQELATLSLDRLDEGVVLSPDGKRLVTVLDDHTVSLWDATDGTELTRLPHDGGLIAITFSPDGTWLVTSSNGFGFLMNAVSRELVALNQDGEVYDVVFSPDSTRLAARLDDGTIRTWDTTKMVELATLPNYDAGGGSGMVFSPDGKQLAFHGGPNPNVDLWDTATGQKTKSLPHSGSVWSAKFSPDGKRLVTRRFDGIVYLWDTDSGYNIAILGRKHGVAFSPDGALLAVGAEQNTALLVDAASGEELAILGHDKQVQHLTFGPDSTRLATVSGDGVVYLWDTTSGRTPVSLRHAGGIQAEGVTFSPDGEWLVTQSDDDMIHLWDATSGQKLGTVQHSGGIDHIALSPGGSRLATIASNGDVYVWDASTGQKQHTLLHGQGVDEIAFSPDGKLLASATSGGAVYVWDVSTGQKQHALPHGQGIDEITFSPDGTRLATCCVGGDSVVLWDMASERKGPTLNSGYYVVRMVFSPDGEQLATIGSNIARLWDVKSAKELTDLLPHCSISDVIFRDYSAGGNVLTTACQGSGLLVDAATGEVLDTLTENGTIDVLNTANGRELVELSYKDEISWVASNSDGTRLATAVGKSVHLWDTANRKELSTLRHDGTVQAIAFSPDGSRLASIGSRDTAYLVDATNGRELARLDGMDQARDIAFSPNGLWLVARTLGSSGVRLWPVNTENLAESSCDIVSRNLTAEEWQQYMGDRPYRKTCPDLPVHTSVTAATEAGTD